MEITLYPEWISKFNRHRARGRLLASGTVLRPGVPGNVCAGRTLTLADFSSARGMAAPWALWGLSDLLDASGHGFTLSTVGTVPSATGIEGVAGTARQFTKTAYLTGSTSIHHEYGSVGCWFKTARVEKGAAGETGTEGTLMTWQSAAQVGPFRVSLNVDGRVMCFQQCGGTGYWQTVGLGRKRCDDNCWHFVMLTWDGICMRVYLDGEAEAPDGYPIGGSPWRGPGVYADAAAPFTIGALYNGTPVSQFYGIIDEVFITKQVLKLEHHRWLYAAKIPYTAPIEPTSVEMIVENHDLNATYSAADFATQPLVGYNFNAGALFTDNYGSLGRTLAGEPDANAPQSSPDVDGKPGGSVSMLGAIAMSASDTGLPSGTSPSTIGCWMKLNQVTSDYRFILNYGPTGWGKRVLATHTGSGRIYIESGGTAGVFGGDFLQDGHWHFLVLVTDNTAFDGARGKAYVDGKVVVFDMTAISTTLIGAGGLCVGRAITAGYYFVNGQIANAFITGYAMTAEEVIKLWAKQGPSLGRAPVEPAYFVEAMTDTDLYVIHDTLDPRATFEYRIT